jgi:N12 class adenine-specific DNA methylase
VLAALEREQRPASSDEQRLLARWSSWGAVPQIFDEHNGQWASERARLKALLDEDAYAAARRTTINAHYTDLAIVQEMWQLVTRLGFDGGRVLEPGVGAGAFLGLAPDGAEMVGVELDPTTAKVAAALYPGATIRAESFAHTRFPGGHFDLVIGNVPFADVRLHDPMFNRGGHSIHNHFLIKSLALTRPGGMVVSLTSHFTLDAQNPAARRELAAMADLLGAVRLPTGAHRRSAGTEAVTDLLVPRRRHRDTTAAGMSWEATIPVEVAGGDVRVNEYFVEHPEDVLGELSVGRGMYNAETLRVTASEAPRGLNGQLAAAADRLAGRAHAQRLAFTSRIESPPVAVQTPLADAADPVPAGLWDGQIEARPGGSFTAIAGGVREPLEVPRARRAELRALLELRDSARRLLSAEAETVEDTEEIQVLRSDLRSGHDRYVSRYGPINRYTLRPTGRTDPDTGEGRVARVEPPVWRIMRSDPSSPLVRALELFDEETQTAAPAALLRQRVVVPRTPALGADTAEDALAIVLDTHGHVDLQHIARLLGQQPDEARAALGDLIYEDPERKELVTAAEYLSGDVRGKLDAARTAAEREPVFERNVTALEEVLPDDVGVEDVEPRLGAAWIDADTHRAFLAEILSDDTVQVEHPGGSVWAVRGRSHTVLATSEWGTGRMPAMAIVAAVVEQRPIRVTDRIDEHTRVLNPTETAAAQEKAHQLQERFSEWVWEDPDRTRRLLAEYNRRFNSLVLRDFTAEGERLTLPGLATSFRPRSHQRAAVAAIRGEPSVGLFHAVGAGKTATMVIAASELRRLGLVKKPAVVVPNHMLEQFSREWLQLLPQARVLAASSEHLAGEQRRRWVARAATNDWDAIIMTRSAFERLPVSQDVQEDYVRREIDRLRAMVDRSEAGDRLTVKRLEKMVLAREQQLEARLDAPRDKGITFEETGIDYLCIDEAHDYKNLATPSKIRDAAIDGSKRASDLAMKLEYLRSRHGRRVATLATGTPIANSITEGHVMLRYLRPDLLVAAGVEEFDSWAATFGTVVTEVEMSPAGGSYRMHSRFARFVNVPEMLRMWHVFADVKTQADLDLPVPNMAAREDGLRLPQIVAIPASPQMTEYVRQLGDRADAVHNHAVSPEEDNMLKVSTDGRKAALDIRLVTGEAPVEPRKLTIAAQTIARIWREHHDRTYIDPATGQPSPTPGALQLVFCDLGTPSADGGWSAYEELRGQLVEHGIPRGEVRFIHDAKDDAQKARLFQAARSGQIAVLIGSTQRMGVGTNIQARVVALHHLDCPWRPADIEQREGRALRQGNQHAEVGIYRYVVEGSFDSYSWQTVERKARFINQVTRGRLDLRELEDIGDNTLSYGEVKAIASRDPLILDLAQATAEHTRLSRLKRAHQTSQHALARTIAATEDELKLLARHCAAVGEAIGRRRSTRGDDFAMTVNGRHVTRRTDAAALLAAWALDHHPRDGRVPAGEIAGLDVDGEISTDLTGARHAEFSLRDLPSAPARLSIRNLRQNAISLVRQLEHRAAELDDLAERISGRANTAERELTTAQQMRGRPLKHADQLADAHARVQQIEAKMRERQSTPTPAPSDAAFGPPVSAEGIDPPSKRPPGRQPTPSPQPGIRAPSL